MKRRVFVLSWVGALTGGVLSAAAAGFEAWLESFDGQWLEEWCVGEDWPFRESM